MSLKVHILDISFDIINIISALVFLSLEIEIASFSHRTNRQHTTMFSPTEMKALVFVPMATGSLSFFGSSSMIVMILWFSRIKLSAVARRILLGLCVYDVFQSLASLATTFPVPPGQGLFGASGNVGTCDAQG